jgi:hypothetical protein
MGLHHKTVTHSGHKTASYCGEKSRLIEGRKPKTTKRSIRFIVSQILNKPCRDEPKKDSKKILSEVSE